MSTAAYSIGYNMKNRSVQRNWTTLNCHSTLSMSYHCLKRRNFGALLMCSSRNTKKSCSMFRVEPSIQHRLHISASYRSIFNAAATDQTSHVCGNDRISFDFWDVAFVGLAAIGVAIGFITSHPYEGPKLLQLEGMDNNDNRLALSNVGVEYSSSGMKADIEMTLHQPPTFHEHVKTVNTLSTDSQATFLKNNISRTKPYDVSQYSFKFDNTFHFSLPTHPSKIL